MNTSTDSQASFTEIHSDEENILESGTFFWLPGDVRKEILRQGKLLTFSSGEYVYRQGQEVRYFYMILKGEVELTLLDKQDNSTIVGHIQPGGHFGEASLLTDGISSLSVKALSNLSLQVINKADFIGLLRRNPAMEHQLSISLAKRLRISYRDLAANLTSRSPVSGIRPKHQVKPAVSNRLSKELEKLTTNMKPVLLTGETGTGRRSLAYEIHRSTGEKNTSYTELDVLDIEASELDTRIFGYHQEPALFSQVDHLGLFEKSIGGTLVLYSAEHLEPDFQRQLVRIISQGRYKKIGGENNIPLQCRIILICRDSPGQQDGQDRLLPSLFRLIADQHYRVAPLRERRRQIPELVDHYLRRYCMQYGKAIDGVDDQTLGMIMNYDWPGNLDEMASVMQRAVILAHNNKPLHSQILLGVPKPEGKWEFNLLSLPPVHRFFTHRLYPLLPRSVVGIFLVLLLAVLFLGADTPASNTGLTLSWEVGWPLLFFSFFFLARMWCSICGLALPGRLAQILLKPKRPTPELLRRHSGWFISVFCIFLFWIELTWDSYHSPLLTGAILLAISSGSLILSMFFERRVWCRYLCPLGGLNALFSMSSILELRANSHMCLNHCNDHACYNGTDNISGCPMFRHPFMVDNNRDCILCGQCIKNCRQQSIHLNLRIAPQELWNQRSPRPEDSLLIVSLAGIFPILTLIQLYPELRNNHLETALSFSIVYFGTLFVHLFGYGLYSWYMARITDNDWKTTSAALSYGFIPLILAAYLALHLELFVSHFLQIPQYFLEFFGFSASTISERIISRDSTVVLQVFTMLGGFLAAVVATGNIIKRKLTTSVYNGRQKIVPTILVGSSAAIYLTLLSFF